MAIFTVNIGAYNNQTASQIGNNTITIDHNATHIFTVANFTTETVPVYTDPEGDALASVKVLTLPATGVLYLNAVPVVANDVISVANINANLFTYIADAGTTTAYLDPFTFDVIDAGSLTLAGLTGTITMNVLAEVNQPPSQVGDGNATIDYGETLVFTAAMFTTLTSPVYSDPEADPASELKILTLPPLGSIQLNGVPVTTNQVISFIDINAGLLTYVPDLADTDGDMQGFTFAIADSGSGTFVS